MRSDIYLVICFDIRTDDPDGLNAVVQTMTELSRSEEGCLAYEFNTNADRTKAYMIEHFRSSDALIEHIEQNASKHSDAWNSHLALSSFVVFGDVSDALREKFPTTAVYARHVAGFTK